jgi:hypothetical protein
VKSLGATGIPYQYPSPHSHTPYLYPYPSLIPIPLSPIPITHHHSPIPLAHHHHPYCSSPPITHHPLPRTLDLVSLSPSATGISRVVIPHHPYSYHSLLIPLAIIHSFIHSLLIPPTITYLIHSYPSPHTTHPLALLITTHSFITSYHSLT